MSWSASVLSSTTSDTEPTVVVTFDSAKYIFNVGENTNRAFLQSRRNWKKTRAMFLSSVGTQRGSGLPGLLMTFADSGLSSMDIVGPYGLLHFLAAMRKYTFRDNMSVNPREVPLTPSSSSTDPVYKDDNITVYALPILPYIETESSISSQDSFGSHTVIPTSSSARNSKRKRTPSPPSSAKRSSQITASESELSLQEAMKKSDFLPAVLRGDLAQSWRRFVIQTMFPGTAIPKVIESSVKPQVISQKGAKKKGKIDDDASVAPTPPVAKISRISQPPGFNKPLPPLEFNYTDSTDISSKPVVAYAVVGPRVRGKFDVKKAEALGLKPGPLRSKVTRGETVTVMVDDGLGQGKMMERTIRPEDCMGQSESPGVMLILDTPTPSHIPLLTSAFTRSSLFTSFRSREVRSQEDHAVRAVFHICGNHVLEDEGYKDFMDGFGSDVQHIVASRKHGHDPVTFTSAAFNQLRLNQLDSEIFKIPKYRLEPDTDIRRGGYLYFLNIVCIRPPRPPLHEKDTEHYDLFHPATSSSAPFSLPELTMKRFAEAKSAIEDRIANNTVPKQPGDDITILPLGTGSAVPSKYRNVSGTLIHIPNYGNILLDAGEGTWGQLARHFGISDTPYNVSQALRDLKCIFISHIHGDHHIGLAKILAMRQSLSPPADSPLYVVANRTVFMYLYEYAALEDLGFLSHNGVVPIFNDAIHWKQNNPNATRWMFESEEEQRSMQLAVSDLCASLNLVSLTTVDVEHRARCHGIIIRHSDGWSIVYSGDTVPTHRLVRAGANATLLIHEATMADDQVEMARAKMHSTFGQAVNIGRSMNAQKILLTHFSARYPKLPPPAILSPPTSATSASIAKEPILALAFDHASIKIGDMWKMNTYMGAIEQCFIDTTEDGDEEENTDALGMTQVDIV
ncbi:hypothetical protein SERLADRAFT_412876 [Serpula lacrymans var. lacrymans S7.9]|uniref:ribonuclease Z n=1 Tax=Serpula lacrymans var. lacrymans (strain S7.9) TaxID=578457 RepID=F8NJ49_SERL9|nr:uncharacterized protein SERLADRAFT_412876 [Serpula lacrymans var. lacrymans S7.9]EGO29330.1 hypothetical protein SERLADRAFT_412876 [Serpula lacrymans var. lacrymans S7.9]